MDELLAHIKGFAEDVADQWRESPILTTLVIGSLVLGILLTVAALM